MWWHKLSVKFSLLIMVLALVPLSVFGLFTISHVKYALLRSIEQTNRDAAQVAAQHIETVITDTIRNIHIIVESSALDNQGLFEQEWSLQLLLKSFPEVNRFVLRNSRGMESLKIGRQRLYFPKDLARGEPIPGHLKDKTVRHVFGKVYRSEYGNLVMDADIYLINAADFQRSLVLTAQVNLNKLLDMVSDNHLLKSGSLFVVDEAGKIVSHPDKSVVLAGETASHTPQAMAFTSGGKVPLRMKMHIGRDGREVISTAWPTRHPRLLVVVQQLTAEALAPVRRIIKWQMGLMLSGLLLAAVISVYFILRTIRPIQVLEKGAVSVGRGEFDTRVPISSNDEVGRVSQAFNKMAANLKRARDLDENRQWVEEGLSRLDDLMRGAQAFTPLCSGVISGTARYLNALIGYFYLADDTGGLTFAAGYAISQDAEPVPAIEKNHGLAGQAAAEKAPIFISDVPEDYFCISSAAGKKLPDELAVIPLVFDGEIEGIMELGFLGSIPETHQAFIAAAGERIAIVVNSVRTRNELTRALARSENQTRELNHQQEELQAANEELEEQTQLLLASENRLKEQQEELQASNEELEEKTEFLERSKQDILQKNQDLEQLQSEISKKAEDLAIASKYKSEFLANMSHELRTPLNSLLLLAKLLSENREANLTPDQIESVNIIHRSGHDLLILINEILDLAKIEAGKMELAVKTVRVKELAAGMETGFRHLARDKGLAFTVDIKENCPDTIRNDPRRIEQILKNLISNAVKFTGDGRVSVLFEGIPGGKGLVILVKDTGIGIPKEQQKIIFEAFQQGEGGTSRKYGGTGLGLSISRELAGLLGGSLSLESRPGQGSVFTLHLPDRPVDATADSTATDPADLPPHPAPSGEASDHGGLSVISDDRDLLNGDDKTVLIIEDDLNFGRTLMKLCRARGFKALCAMTGEDGLLLAEKYLPQAVILDIKLPGIDGWTVLETLKSNPSTRHIPVHFMSVDAPIPEAFSKGAIGYLTKPVSKERLEEAFARIEAIVNKKMKELLIIEDNDAQRRAIRKLIGNHDVLVYEATTGKQAMDALRTRVHDCLILDLGLPDMSGFDLLERIRNDPDLTLPPVVVYTGRDLSTEEEDQLRVYSESIIIKGARSEERLLDETTLFLHRMVETLPFEKRKIIRDIHDSDQMLTGKNILIVDDDMRNVFALSKVLVQRGMNTVKAENGKKALEILDEQAGVDLILMDIMMPEMDGYEAMQRIRANERTAQIPIIALTAKAMKQDKANCIQAGASDYLPKPVDINRLLSMMRVWLYR